MNDRSEAMSQQPCAAPVPRRAAQPSLRQWWLQRLEQELQTVLFEGLSLEAPAPATQAPQVATAQPRVADPGGLLVNAVPRGPLGEPARPPWGDDSELITDWFDQGDNLAERPWIIEDAHDGFFGATQEGL